MKLAVLNPRVNVQVAMGCWNLWSYARSLGETKRVFWRREDGWMDGWMVGGGGEKEEEEEKSM